MSFLIQRAVSSLWNVARRRYTGQAGEVTAVAARAVRYAIYGPIAAEGSVVRTMSHELTKKDLQGAFSGINARMTGPGLPDEDEWDPDIRWTSYNRGFQQPRAHADLPGHSECDPHNHQRSIAKVTFRVAKRCWNAEMRCAPESFASGILRLPDDTIPASRSRRPGLIPTCGEVSRGKYRTRAGNG